MARWHQKDHDRLEKVGKMRKKKLRRGPREAEVAEGFERDEAEWAVGGEGGAFAARVVEVHKRYCFVSSEAERGKVKTNDVWLATTARKFLVANRAERNFVAVGDRVLCLPAPEQTTGNPTDLPQCV